MPRKSVAAEPEDGESAFGPDGILSYELPKSTVIKVMKSGFSSEDVKVSKDVPLALQKGSTVFVNYISALAHEVATEQNQKTITAAHVLEAVKQLGYDDQAQLLKSLKSELSAFRSATAAKKSGASSAKGTGSAPASKGGEGQEGEEELAYEPTAEDEAEAEREDGEEAGDVIEED